MVEVSIICLIYKSTKLADMVYESVMKHTPMIHEGKAEFFFVANNPTEEVLNHLETKKYPYVTCWTDVLTDKELYDKGFGKPSYMRNVYQGYNYGVLKAKGKRVVLINSDNFFSEDWLENLLKYSEYKNIVCSTLVEPGKKEFSVFPGAIQQNFGDTSNTYNEEDFLKYAKSIRKTGIKLGGVYMPCIFYKEIGIQAGLYPEGNIRNENFDDIKEFGDENFYHKLNDLGVIHLTAKDSIVYHLKEGEKSETGNEIVNYQKTNYTFKPYFNYNSKNIVVNLTPTINHNEVILNLLSRVTVFIYKYSNIEEIKKQINSFNNQTYKNLDIIVCLENNSEYKEELKKEYPSVIISENKYTDLGTQLYNEIYNMEGSFMLFSSPKLQYNENYIEELVNTLKNNGTYLKNVYKKETNETHIGMILFQKLNFTKEMIKNLNLVLEDNIVNNLNPELNMECTTTNNLISNYSLTHRIKRKIKRVLRKIKNIIKR